MENILGQVVKKLAGLSGGHLNAILDLLVKLTGKAGAKWLEQLNRFLRKQATWEKTPSDELLKLVSTDGAFYLGNKDHIGECFSDFDKDIERDVASIIGTKQVTVNLDMYEATRRASSVEIFATLNPDIQELCFTRKELSQFGRKYFHWQIETGTVIILPFFDTEDEDEILIAHLHALNDEQLIPTISRLGDTYLNDSSCLRFVVVNSRC